jgi:hypothetical protein
VRRLCFGQQLSGLALGSPSDAIGLAHFDASPAPATADRSWPTELESTPNLQSAFEALSKAIVESREDIKARIITEGKRETKARNSNGH